MLQNGVSHRRAFVKLSAKGGTTHFGEVLERVSRDMGYRSNRIAISCGMGSLRTSTSTTNGSLNFG